MYSAPRFNYVPDTEVSLPVNLQEIANKLPPFFILAIILEIRGPYDKDSDNGHFNYFCGLSKVRFDYNMDVEDFLSSDHPDAAQLWEYLNNRDIPQYDSKKKMKYDQKTYLTFICINIIHTLSVLYDLYGSFFKNTFNNQDILNVKEIEKNCLVWDADNAIFFPRDERFLENNHATVARLVSKLIHSDLHDRNEKTFLMRIVEHATRKPQESDSSSLICALLSAPNIEINKRDFDGKSALHYAANGKNTKIMALLLLAGADANSADISGYTPLFCLSFSKENDELCQSELDIPIFLVHAYANANHLEKNFGNNALGVASNFGNPRVAKVLLDWGVSMDAVNKNGETAVMIAARAGHAEFVRVLLKHSSININQQNNNGDTALHLTAGQGYQNGPVRRQEKFLKTEEILVNYGADFRLLNKKNETPISIQASKNSNDILYFHKEAIDKVSAIKGGLITIVLGVGIGLALGLWKDFPEELELSAWAITLIAIAPVSLFLIGFCAYRKQSQLKYTENTSLLSQPSDEDNNNPHLLTKPSNYWRPGCW